MAARKIVDLRNLLAERFPQPLLPAAGRLMTGLRFSYKATKGGLTKGAITELNQCAPQRRQRLAYCRAITTRLSRSLFRRTDRRARFVRSAIGRRRRLAASALGALPESAEAMQAADLLLRDGNFPLVILDLVLNPMEELRKIPQTNWYRLQRLVEPAPTAFLVLTRRSMISSAQWKLVLENRWTLTQLDWAAEELQAQWKIRVQRAQPNKWRSEKEIAAGRLMFAALYLPDFALQAALRHEPELHRKPVALLDDEQAKATIIQLTKSPPRRAGVRQGMTPSQGLARCLSLRS